jgi:hypothetical protein
MGVGCNLPDATRASAVRSKRSMSPREITRVRANRFVKHLEIVADNFSKADWSWDWSGPSILAGEQSGLLTRTAMTESVSLCADEKTESVSGTGSGNPAGICDIRAICGLMILPFPPKNSIDICPGEPARSARAKSVRRLQPSHLTHRP